MEKNHYKNWWVRFFYVLWLWSLIKADMSWNQILEIPLELLVLSVLFILHFQYPIYYCVIAGTLCSLVIQVSTFNVIVYFHTWLQTPSVLLCLSTLWKDQSVPEIYSIKKLDSVKGWFPNNPPSPPPPGPAPHKKMKTKKIIRLDFYYRVCLFDAFLLLMEKTLPFMTWWQSFPKERKNLLTCNSNQLSIVYRSVADYSEPWQRTFLLYSFQIFQVIMLKTSEYYCGFALLLSGKCRK